MEIKNYFSWDILDNTLELLLSSSSAVSLCCKNKLPTSFSVDDDGKAGTFGNSQARVIFMSPGWASISASRSTLSEKLTSFKSSSTAWRRLRLAGGVHQQIIVVLQFNSSHFHFL